MGPLDAKTVAGNRHNLRHQVSGDYVSQSVYWLVETEYELKPEHAADSNKSKAVPSMGSQDNCS